eukprot:m.34533 g.34533  ORF g.34533 m.34533 type:complete len:414 (+) comp31990_c0_seq2:69-1310(+)
MSEATGPIVESEPSEPTVNPPSLPKEASSEEKTEQVNYTARFETLKSEGNSLLLRQKRLEAEKYLNELLKDKMKLSVLENVFHHCDRLIDVEIKRASDFINNPQLMTEDGGPPPAKMARLSQSTLDPQPTAVQPTAAASEDTTTTIDPNMKLTEKIRRLKSGQQLVQSFPNGAVQIYEKIYMPVAQFPHVKYAGRIIGTNGMTVKELHKETKCRIVVQGKGSLKSMHEEENLRGKEGYEHLEDDLNVLIEATGAEQEARSKVQYAKLLILEIANPSVDPMQVIERHRVQRLQGIPVTMQFPSIDLLLTFSSAIPPFMDFLPNLGMTRGGVGGALQQQQLQQRPPFFPAGMPPMHSPVHMQQQQQLQQSPFPSPAMQFGSFLSGQPQSAVPVSQQPSTAQVGLSWSLNEALGRQ